ncbi:MAG: molybdopterin-dependent oxidoreductase, partial [Friedmanniella sp.]
NNIDFRARPHSDEEAQFLAAAVAGTGRGVTFADLESASSVLMVCFEPEEDAGAVFLRLRKAMRKHGLASWTLAPLLSRGAAKMGARLVPTLPGGEAAVLDVLDLPLDAGSVILVGERAAQSSGTLSACLRLAERTGARLAWIPRRAGDRGAVEAGCLPNLLPGGRPVSDPAARIDAQATWGVGALPTVPGRDADEMIISATDDQLSALVVAGVDPADLTDPRAALQALEEIDFVVSLETRVSAVTDRADVVFPVSLVSERAGTYLNWEGRDRHFGAVLAQPNTMSDLRVLAALAEGLGGDLGFRTPEGARAELAELGAWEGTRSPAPRIDAAGTGRGSATTLALATWRMAIDDSRAVDGEPFLLATARPPVALMSPGTADAAGLADAVTVSNDRGALTLPLRRDPDMVDGVVWLPTKAPGLGVAEHLAAVAGDLVSVSVPVPSAQAPSESQNGSAA